jgi:hypothetical protein
MGQQLALIAFHAGRRNRERLLLANGGVERRAPARSIRTTMPGLRDADGSKIEFVTFAD